MQGDSKEAEKENSEEKNVELNNTNRDVESIDVVEDDVVYNTTNFQDEEEDNSKTNNQAILMSSSSNLQVQDTYAEIAQTVLAINNMKALAQILIKSSLCPLKKEEDVILAIITGKQLKLPYTASINNIYCVNNKPTLSAHLQRALILREGISFRKIYDFEPVYQFYKTDDNGTFVKVPHKTDQNKTVPIPIAVGTIYDKFPDAKYFGNEIDRITKYEFKRKIKQSDGIYVEMVIYSEFRMSDAQKAGLLEKDNWMKYPARMCDARASTNGIKEIASDITLGLPSLSELADEYGIRYNISSTLEETVIQ
jgi:hypothetical protein